MLSERRPRLRWIHVGEKLSSCSIEQRPEAVGRPAKHESDGGYIAVRG